MNPKTPANAPFQFIAIEDFNPRPPAWLIEGILPATADAKLISLSGFGKTFLALDIAMHIATGTPWLGKYAVKRGVVAYIVAEGDSGFPKRNAAWKLHYAIGDPVSVYVLPAAPQLDGRDGPDVVSVLAALKALPNPPVLIVIDTQSRCMEGKDENSAKDMTRFLGAIARLREETGATTLVLHHPGWDGNRERGSSTQRATADTVMVIEKDGDWGADETLHPGYSIRLRCIKQKDDAAFEPVILRARRVDLPPNADSKPQSSLVLELPAPLSREQALAEFWNSPVPPDKKRTPAWETNAKIAVAAYQLGGDSLAPSISALGRTAGVAKSTASASIKRLSGKRMLLKNGDGYRLAPALREVLAPLAPSRGYVFFPNSPCDPLLLEIRPEDWTSGESNAASAA